MVDALLERMARALDAHAIPYMIIGGQAVLLYGEPRVTQDIDITLGTTPDRLSEVVAAVAEAGCAPLVSNPADFAAQTMVLPCASKDSKMRVDLVFSFTPYECQAIERARAVRVGDTDIRYASLEDLVIHKIFAGRPRDLDDVRGILLRHPEANMRYIKEWLTRFEEDLQQPFLDRLSGLLA